MAAVGRMAARLACALALTLTSVPITGLAPASLEDYQIKAAYVLNFARFIEWPDSESNKGPVIVGVVGSNLFGSALESALNGKTVRGRPFSVRIFRSFQEIDECHILFLGSSAAPFVRATVQHFSGIPVLTVSDNKDFVDAGGAIGFVVVDSRLRFDINLSAIASAQLKANAQLLAVAHALRGSLK